MSRLTCALKSAKRPLLSQLNCFWVLAALSLSAAGCGSSDRAAPVADDDGGTSHSIPTTDPCATPAQGCECKEADAVVDCGQIERRSGSYVSCSMGHRTCTDG